MFDEEKTEISTITKESLEKVGIQVSTDIEMFKVEREMYVKVDSSIVGKVNMVMQQLPQVLMDSAYSGDVYRVIYDKGLGVLQKSAQYPGQLLGNVVSPTANNQIRDVARLQEMSMLPHIVSSVFSVMSMITGQYFMAQINSNLSRIEKEVSEIRRFLEDDKRSKLQSEEEFLKMTQKTIRFILDNEVQKQSILTSIQKIRMDSLASINFYKMQINNIKDDLEKKDKAEDIINNIKNVCSLVSEYWYSLYLYCFAVYLEPVVAQNFDADYLDILKADIVERCKEYKKNYLLWLQVFDGYIESAKAFEDNKVLKGLKLVGTKGLSPVIGGIADVADFVDKYNKVKKKGTAKEILSKGTMWENIEAIEKKQQELSLFSSLHNGRLELIVEGEDMYVKLPV